MSVGHSISLLNNRVFFPRKESFSFALEGRQKTKTRLGDEHETLHTQGFREYRFKTH